MTKINEATFIRKFIMKMILVKKNGLLMTRTNYEDIIKKIGFWIGRIAKGGKDNGGFTDEEVGHLMEILNEGFIEGAVPSQNDTTKAVDTHKQ